ncbi:uncharacterized protein M6B38_121545 [Iris pallida]|uniref:Syntaxin 6/10/61 N-terminal domain-containing protein n=1 Tax=Iris pallida TaxID=29817 RepID=A0AAX6H837_IRIPA|nr:uncharacterized protein M6B38_121545 [Iris pallida]
MAAISSFDQWKKDVFFSAAEEVQESADTLESVYRMWARERTDGFESEISDELRRELHTRLGTAMWQLEEFERAVSSSYENYPSEENTINRHREFVAALRNQICCTEKAMNDSLLAEGKQPLPWVQLDDDDERDEFETFLSSAPSSKTFPETKDRYVDRKSARGFKETVTINNDAKYVVEVAAKDDFRNHDQRIVQEEDSNGKRRSWSPPDVDAWKIVIADEEDVQKRLSEMMPQTHNRLSSLNGFFRSVESSTARLVWLRSSFQKAKREENIQSRQGFAQGIDGSGERGRTCFRSSKEDSRGTKMQQTVGRFGGFRRSPQGLQSKVQFRRSLRFTLLPLLTIFLIVPFVLYAN